MHDYPLHQPYAATASAHWYRCSSCDEKQPEGAMRVWVPQKDFEGWMFTAWCQDCARTAQIKFEVRDV